MSLLVLLITVVIAFVLSNLVDVFPGLLWGWLVFPKWLIWGALLAVLAWGMGSPPAER
ncbi:MAG: hypothetical protein AAFP07_12445 [Cyanobacteria bacterium J06606_4]